MHCSAPSGLTTGPHSVHWRVQRHCYRWGGSSGVKGGTRCRSPHGDAGSSGSSASGRSQTHSWDAASPGKLVHWRRGASGSGRSTSRNSPNGAVSYRGPNEKDWCPCCRAGTWSRTQARARAQARGGRAGKSWMTCAIMALTGTYTYFMPTPQLRVPAAHPSRASQLKPPALAGTLKAIAVACSVCGVWVHCFNTPAFALCCGRARGTHR